MAASHPYDFSVQSSLGDYEVRFRDDLVAELQGTLRSGDVVVADRAIVDLHRERLGEVLKQHRVMVLDATEQQKSYREIAPLIEELCRCGFGRGDRLVALGGGITQDITAFMSSILYRGVDWIFVPTTLLAQGDSCIGSKTSINCGEFKNQLGGFYPPRVIVIDTEFLRTLPRQELLSGLGEMAHYFPIAGHAAFCQYAERLPEAMRDGSDLDELINESLRIKRGYIERDEFDRAERQVFNYGHSFGHALESVTGYAMPHGIAVSYGMDLANLVSVRLGFLDPTVRTEIREPLKAIWQEVPMPVVDLQKFGAALKHDKKNRGDHLGLILTKGFGQMFKHYCTMDQELSKWIAEFFVEIRQ